MEDGVAAMAACYAGFDPAAYLQYNYTAPRADFTRRDSIVPWKLGCLHRAFTEVTNVQQHASSWLAGKPGSLPCVGGVETHWGPLARAPEPSRSLRHKDSLRSSMVLPLLYHIQTL
ncbi:unnamed protein product [Merluccius merluccius]